MYTNIVHDQINIGLNLSYFNIEKRTQIIALLVEGTSLRATARIADVAFNTVLKLLPEIGAACLRYHDEHVRNVNAKRVECDEIWSFIYGKDRNLPENKKG
jgi:IS1 family transposase